MKNTPKIKGLQSALQALGAPAVDLDYLEAVDGVPSAGQFRSEVVGRAQMVDLSKDGKPRMGIERVQTQDLLQLSSESGPNGEAVYKPVNDWEDSVRFVGSWAAQNDSAGIAALSVITGDFIEITFYGTGLNCLMLTNDGVDRGFDIEIDGVSTGSVSTVGSNVLGGRNYSPNLVYPIASGLSLGLHTVKLTKTTAFSSRVSGYEVINERSDILVPAFTRGDGQVYPETTLALAAPGSKGGRALIYADDSGVQQAVQATDATALYLGAADHSNESVIAEHFWREFGAGRAAGDDFSTLGTSTSNRAFTVDDGSVTLVGDNVASLDSSGIETIRPAALNASFIITFIGTGLSVDAITNISGLGDDIEVTVDGSVVGILDLPANANAATRRKEVVSGLPYGTHTVKFERVVSVAAAIMFSKFIVYGPKKPSLPKDAVELGEYFVMSDYLKATDSLWNMSQGVLHKSVMREAVYVGGWAILLNTTSIQDGFKIYDTNLATNEYAEYSFYGSGIEFQGETQGDAGILDVFIDDVQLTSANFPSVTIHQDGSKFNFTTGTFDQYGAAGVAGFAVTGLDFTAHTIKVQGTQTKNGSSSGFWAYLTGFKVITPIHSPKLNGPFVKQNTLRVGSESIGDLRKLEGNVRYYETTNITNQDTSGLNAWTPTSLSLSLPAGTYEVGYYAHGYKNGAGVCNVGLYKNGNNITKLTDLLQINGFGSHCMARQTVMILKEEATLQLQIRTANDPVFTLWSSGTSYTGGFTDPDTGGTILWARKISE